MPSRLWSAALALGLLCAGAGTTMAGLAPEATNWPHVLGGVAVTQAIGDQQRAAAIEDAQGGLIVVWQDHRGSTWDIYMQRVGENAVPIWAPASGVSVCTAAGDQTDPAAVPDGAGGIFVVWKDRRFGNDDVYATHISNTGTPVTGWPVSGKPIAGSVKDEQFARAASDENGGFYVAWQLVYTPGSDIDVWCTRMLGNGSVAAGFPVAVSQGGQFEQLPDIASDGSGGVVLAWEDNRWATYNEPGAHFEIFAQHVLSSGALYWPGGLQFSSDYPGYYDNHTPKVAADRAGGLWAAWSRDDYQVYGIPSDLRVTRRILNGAIWANATFDDSGTERTYVTPGDVDYLPRLAEDFAQGVFLFYFENSARYLEHLNSAGNRLGRINLNAEAQNTHLLVTTGGAMVAWEGDGLRAQKVDAYATRWMGDGGSPVGPQVGSRPRLTSDASGGAFVVFEQPGNGKDIFVNRVEPFGRLGNPEPTIVAVRDLPADQGGSVRITWTRSYLDTLPTMEVASYGVWRQVSGTMMAEALNAGGRLLEAGEMDTEVRPGLFRISSLQSAQTTYWEGVANVPARGQSSYVATVPSLGDSTGFGIPFTVFRVDAHGAFAPGYWDSRPDSGYSVDNLAPGVPAHLVFHKPGSLTWDPVTERDFAYFTVYGSSSPTFGGRMVEIDQTTATSLNVQTTSYAYYFVTASDASGNEGSPAGVANTVGVPVPGELPERFALRANYPNPFRGSTAIGFDLPKDGPVHLNVFDLAGHRVATLIESTLPAGRYDIVWTGKNERGERLAPGIYFYAYEAGAYRETRRLVLLR